MRPLPRSSYSPTPADSAVKKSRLPNLINSRKKRHPAATPDPHRTAADQAIPQGENIVLWSNRAYSLDDRSSSVAGDALPCGAAEELRLREELAREIEKELEREIMEGILALVRRLSDLKAKQIARGIGRPHAPCDDYTAVALVDMIPGGRDRRGGVDGFGGEGGASGARRQAGRCSDAAPSRAIRSVREENDLGAVSRLWRKRNK